MISANQILVKSPSNIHSHIIFFRSSTKMSYSLSINPVLGASVAMNKRFSKFTCDNWFRSRVLANFIFEKNLSTHAVLRGNLCVSKEVSEARKVSFFLVLAIHQFHQKLFFLGFTFFKHILMKPRPLFNCSYTVNIPNLVYSNGFIGACFSLPW